MSTYTCVYLHLYEWIYCDVCDHLCIERFYRNHLESKTHTNNIRKTDKLNK